MDFAGKKKKARRESAPSFKLYFQNSKLEGKLCHVLQLYCAHRFKHLKIGGVWGLDKNFPLALEVVQFEESSSIHHRLLHCRCYISRSTAEEVMANWTVQTAKARFSEFLAAAIKDGPQFVTRRGVKVAVLVSIEEWRRLRRNAAQA